MSAARNFTASDSPGFVLGGWHRWSRYMATVNVLGKWWRTR